MSSCCLGRHVSPSPQTATGRLATVRSRDCLADFWAFWHRSPKAVRFLAIASVFVAAFLTVTASSIGRGQAAAQDDILSRYGLSVTLPAGWHGHISPGVIAAATFPIPPGDTGFGSATLRRVGHNDVLLLLSEYEPLPGEHLLCLPRTHAPSLGLADLRKAIRRPMIALANFCLSGRHFTLFGKAGANTLQRSVLSQVNQVLGSFTVRRGDFYPGTVPPARFPARPGWHVGTGAAGAIQAQGEQTETYASTVPYRNGPNDLPPVKTIQRLGRNDILIWLGLYRDSRRPPPAFNNETRLPLRVNASRIFANWEGNPNYGRDGLYRQVAARPGQYDLDLWVFFGAAHPSQAVVARAQAMLDAVRLPRWPRFG